MVYTAVNCARDQVRPIASNPSAEFVCFHDDAHAIAGWDVRPMEYLDRDPARTTRWYKLHPQELFPHAAATVWIDASMHPRLAPDLDVPALVERLLDGAQVATSRHPERSCVYDESEVCKQLWLDHASVLDAQMARYRAAGHPQQHGLYENGLLVRCHTPQVRRFDDAWWSEIGRGSWRDQLSMPVALRAVDIALHALPPGFARDNPWFEYIAHPHIGHPALRREFVAAISARHGADDPRVKHVVEALHAADLAVWRWTRRYEREQRRRAPAPGS